MKKHTKIVSFLIVSLTVLTFIVSPLTVPRIPPLPIRTTAEVTSHYVV
ncbi:MAG: hypothetical protein JJU16_04530 [Alkalibacterium sp.]|nr:hypothetical protein [Alkalibacterium sp.]